MIKSAIRFSSFLVFILSISIHSAFALNNKGLAVILVDMQEGFYDRGGVWGTNGLQTLVNKQIELLDWAKAQDIPVLIFEYRHFGKTDPDLMAHISSNTHSIVEKVNDNGFTNSSTSKDLAVKKLKEWNVDTIIMAGINGCCCIKGSALGAIEAGFDVLTSSDIVGNINQNPPLYPNSTWFFKDNSFVVFDNLEQIIK